MFYNALFFSFQNESRSPPPFALHKCQFRRSSKFRCKFNILKTLTSNEFGPVFVIKAGESKQTGPRDSADSQLKISMSQ